MQVDRIGYDPRTGQYLVFPTDSSDLINLNAIREWIKSKCPKAISPYLRSTNFGSSVSFGIVAQYIDQTIPLLVQHLRPALPSTACWVRLGYQWGSCKKHYQLRVGFTMAPGLPLQESNDVLQAQLDGLLQVSGVPKDLLKGVTWVTVETKIRAACSKIGIYAQGVQVESRTDKENPCVACSKK